MQHTHHTVLIAAGGSGGHLYPAQALAKDLFHHDPSIKVHFMGYKLCTNAHFDREAFPYTSIASATISLRKPIALFKGVVRLLQGTLQSYRVLKRTNPSLVVGFGSFHSFPVLAAAKLLRIPYVLFESNAVLGKVNKVFARGAYKVAHQLFDMPGGKNLIKTQIPRLGEKWERQLPETARLKYGLDPHCFTLLVFGGSQGAQSLNTLVIESMPFVKEKQMAFQVIHIVGSSAPLETIQKRYAALGIKAFVTPYEKHMGDAYSAAHMTLSRAGANTIAEQMYHELPSVLIPYPYLADRHQHCNAQYLVNQVQGAKMLDQNGLTPQVLAEALVECMQEKTFLHMKQRLAYVKREKIQDLTLAEVIVNILK